MLHPGSTLRRLSQSPGSFARPPRRTVSLLTIIILTLVFLSRISSLGSTRPEADVIVSLSSSLARLELELPLTIDSLLAQTVLPREIRVYLARGEEDLVREKVRVRGWHWDVGEDKKESRVSLRFVDDQGPGTKFLPLLTGLLSLASHPPPPSPTHLGDPLPPSALDQALVILDDDHHYSPHLISTLLSASDSGLYPPDAVLGLRGWRINRHLGCGVAGAREYARHVVEGWRIGRGWRVGVLTANKGYLIRPRMFVPPHLIPSDPTHLPKEPYHLSGPILDYSSAPPAAKFVDDIWINYHLSALLHPRYIVPFPHAPSLDITLPSSHTLESHLSDASLTRAEANNEMLAYGSDAWVAEVESPFAEEREADQLDWYLPEGETSEMGREETEPEWEGRLVVSWRVVGRWCVGWELRAKWGRWVGW